MHPPFYWSLPPFSYSVDHGITFHIDKFSLPCQLACLRGALLTASFLRPSGIENPPPPTSVGWSSTLEFHSVEPFFERDMVPVRQSSDPRMVPTIRFFIDRPCCSTPLPIANAVPRNVFPSAKHPRAVCPFPLTSLQADCVQPTHSACT